MAIPIYKLIATKSTDANLYSYSGSDVLNNYGKDGEIIWATDTRALYVAQSNVNVPVGLYQVSETSTGTATMSEDVKVHWCNSASDYTLTLPSHPASGTKHITVINKNTGVVTLSPTSGNIGGASTL